MHLCRRDTPPNTGNITHGNHISSVPSLTQGHSSSASGTEPRPFSTSSGAMGVSRHSSATLQSLGDLSKASSPYAQLCFFLPPQCFAGHPLPLKSFWMAPNPSFPEEPQLLKSPKLFQFPSLLPQPCPPGPAHKASHLSGTKAASLPAPHHTQGSGKPTVLPPPKPSPEL